MRAFVIAVLFLSVGIYRLIAQQPTKADTGTDLFHACQATIRVMDSTSQSESVSTASDYCIGYFEGFADVIQFNGSSLCLNNARIGTVIRVYVAYMEKNPKLLDSFKVIGVTHALREAYPCAAKE